MLRLMKGIKDIEIFQKHKPTDVVTSQPGSEIRTARKIYPID